MPTTVYMEEGLTVRECSTTAESEYINFKGLVLSQTLELAWKSLAQLKSRELHRLGLPKGNTRVKETASVLKGLLTHLH